ncbi:MAG: hypothetical protein [Microviridae sp. ctYqV29]|nr:MAG: hypothetical protein [Microviridae sp. ctYqV29]
MASKSKSKRMRSVRRIVNVNTTRFSVLDPVLERAITQDLLDNRAFSPSPLRRLRTLLGTPARLRARLISKVDPVSYVSPYLDTVNPLKAVHCVRRKIRRQVIFALGKSGKGAGPRKRPRRTDTSDLRC